MKRRNVMGFSFVLCCALIGGATWIASTNSVHGLSREEAAADARASKPLAGLNDKARAAKGGDEAAVRALADEIFGQFNTENAPAGLADAMKDRVVRAELNYRAGRGKGISEADAVRMVNRLAHEIGAPAFARSDVFELRRLRAGLLPYTSDLQSRAAEGPAGRKNPHEPSMSPLEATYFAVLLVQQKRFNPEFQLTHDEWVELHGGKRKNKANAKFHDKIRERRDDATRTEEMQKAFEDGLSKKSVAQLLELPAALLDTLGVQR
jgi:hypothetical protein